VKLGDRIRHARTKRKWTQLELARQAGVVPDVISRLETGRTQQGAMTTLASIARALGTTVDALVGTPPHYQQKTGAKKAPVVKEKRK
jgi:transcriptional regulator with XRE-family HTH domain